MYLTQGLHRSLQRHPQMPALRHLGADGAVALDVAGLVQRVAQWAAGLQANGVAPGDRVALLSPNNPALVQQLLACWWLGAVVCPLNPRWPAPLLHAVVADCGASLLLVDPSLALLSAQAGLASALEAGASELDSPSLAGQAAQRLPLADSRTGGDALAALLYTAGTTGRPKGVMLSHANLCAAALAQAAALHPPPGDATALLLLPLCQGASLGRLVLQVMVGAPCLTLAQPSPAAVLAALAEQGVSDVLLPPHLLQGLLDLPGLDARRLPALRRIAVGLAAVPAPLLRRARAAWPGVDVVQAYGLTETAAVATADAAAQANASHHGWPGSVGRASLAAELRIADEQGADLPVGQIGQVLVRGPMVMQGYWQQPDATAAALQGGWLHTGDAGHLDAHGHLFIADRLPDIIRSGGEDVYSTEVEAVLRQHPVVADVAVVGLAHAVWGQAVHAVVVLEPGALPQPDALRRFCRKHLAGFKCPRSLSFVASLPVTAAGQVQKAKLREGLQKQMARPPS